MSDIKERLLKMANTIDLSPIEEKIVREASFHIVTLESKIIELRRELQYIADDCADSSPPSYGAIRKAAEHAIVKSLIIKEEA